MRLCFAIPALTAGGAERVMSILANRWAVAGHEVVIITTHDGGRAPHFQLEAGVRLVSADPCVTGPAKQFAIIRRLRQSLRDVGPDAIISFLNYTNIVTLLASVGLDRPVIVSERLDPRVIGIGPAWSLLRRLTYRRAARLVVQTPTAARLYEPLLPDRTRVIPNPVPPPPADAGDRPTLLSRPTIIAMGRLHPQKGFDLALRAIALLAADFPDWQLVILGEGPERPRLEALRAELGLGSRVHLPGSVGRPADWLRHAQVFLMSSRTEGFPNALCEAMAVGLPVVSTDCPSGPADLITTDWDGLLVATEDVTAIADGLRRLLGSEPLRAQLGARAPGVVVRYHPDAVTALWDALLDEVMDESRRR